MLQQQTPDAQYAVMALAWGYPPSAYSAFAGSLRRTGFGGAIIVFQPKSKATPLPDGSNAAALYRSATVLT